MNLYGLLYSFIGALGTVEKKDSLVFTKDYYAVRRHQERQSDGARVKPKTPAEFTKYAGLVDEPIRFDIEIKVAELLNRRMKDETTDAERKGAGDVPPRFEAQPFQVGDGSLRCYVRAEWKSGKGPNDTPDYVLASTGSAAPIPRSHTVPVPHLR
jgi:hypothetical protein